MGVPNHQEERSTLLIVWLGQLGVNLVNLVKLSIFVVMNYFPTLFKLGLNYTPNTFTLLKLQAVCHFQIF